MGQRGVAESVAVLQGALCWSRDNSFPLAAAQNFVSFCLFLPTIFLCLVFFILIMVPTVMILHGLEFIQLLTAAVTTALPNESTTSHVIIFRASFEGM